MNPESKAHDHVNEGEKFENLMLFIIDNGGAVINHYYVDNTTLAFLLNGGGAKSTREFLTKTNAAYVYAVGNLGTTAGAYYTALGLGAPSQGAALPETLTTLRAKTVAMDQALNGLTGINDTDHTGATALKGLPVAGGSNKLTWTPSTASNTTDWGANAAITMELLPVRLDVIINNKQTNYNEAGAYQIEEIAILYGGYKTQLFAAASGNAGQKYVPAYAGSEVGYFRSGLSTWTTLLATPTHGAAITTQLPALSQTYVAPYMGGTYGAGGAASTENFQKTFYIYNNVNPFDAGSANNDFKSELQKTKSPIVTVRANNGTDDLFYSAILSEYYDMSSYATKYLQNGYKYTVTLNLKGDAKTGGGGDPDPEKPVVDGYVDVLVTAATWQAGASIIKDFE